MHPNKVLAAVMTGPGRIEAQSFPYPDIGDDAMVIALEMCGICGTDKHTYRGETMQYGGTPAEQSTPFPIIPGHEIVGKVAEIGRRARSRLEYYGKELNVGDRVVMCPDILCGRCWYCRNTSGFPLCENIRGYGNHFTATEAPHLMGGWAEHIYVRPDALVYKVPDSDRRRARGDDRTDGGHLQSRQGEVVLLDGRRGLRLGRRDRSPGGRSDGPPPRLQGPHHGRRRHHRPRPLRLPARHGKAVRCRPCDQRLGSVVRPRSSRPVRDLTQGRGADLALECTGVAEAIPTGIEMVRRGGMYVVAGVFADVGTITLNPHHIAARQVRLIGMCNHPSTGYVASLKLLEKFQSSFPLRSFVTHRFKVGEADDAMAQAMKIDEAMKVVITP